mmetsp:Transcript_3129/g.5694  ORF Transcript_3129/g.5694 Transcript_3129/m.5694 type:complete len:236 (+) Transcript_3129:236-943(+)
MTGYHRPNHKHASHPFSRDSKDLSESLDFHSVPPPKYSNHTSLPKTPWAPLSASTRRESASLGKRHASRLSGSECCRAFPAIRCPSSLPRRRRTKRGGGPHGWCASRGSPANRTSASRSVPLVPGSAPERCSPKTPPPPWDRSTTAPDTYAVRVSPPASHSVKVNSISLPAWRTARRLSPAAVSPAYPTPFAAPTIVSASQARARRTFQTVRIRSPPPSDGPRHGAHHHSRHCSS